MEIGTEDSGKESLEGDDGWIIYQRSRRDGFAVETQI